MTLSTLTATLNDEASTQTATFLITIQQQANQWVATWEDPEIGVYEVTAATKASALRKAMYQQRETEILKQIERCMDFLVDKCWLSEAADAYLTDALFTR